MILDQQQAARKEDQKLIDESPIITLPRLTNAPLIRLTRNPTAKHNLRTTPRLHRCVTHNNLPGVTQPATTIEPISEIPTQTQRPRQRLTTPTQVQPRCGPRATRSEIPSGAHQQIVTRHAVNLLTLQEEASFSTMHTPHALLKHAKVPINFEHYANPMVHPVTGHTISSYKKLMWCTRMAILEARGPHAESMHFILVPLKTTTGAVYITCRRQELTEYTGPLNCFRNIVSCHHSHSISTSMH